MMTEEDAFETDLAASLDTLADQAPPAPDAAAMHGRLRRRHHRRVGLTGAAVAAVAAAAMLCTWKVMPHRPSPSPPVQVVQAPAPTVAPAPRVAPSPLMMPTAGFVSVAQPGCGADGRLNVRAPTMTMSAAPIRQTAGGGVTMNAPTISMPRF